MGIEVGKNDLNNVVNVVQQGTGNGIKKDELVFGLVVFSMMQTMFLLITLDAFMSDVSFFFKLVVSTGAFGMSLPVSMGIVEFSKRYKNLIKTENK